MKRVFVKNINKWVTQEEKKRTLNLSLKAPCYHDAILLPLRRRKDIITIDGTYEGGVCTKDFEFLAGIQRDYSHKKANYSCCRSYNLFDSKITYRKEKVVFGGILFQHFGNMIVDALSRMWWFAENPNTPYKFVFLMMEKQKFLFPEFLNLAGLTEDRYEIITEPTQFEEVIIPDEAIYSVFGASPKWLQYFDLIKENVKNKEPSSLPIEKVYLTRTQLEYSDGIDEEYYENFYAARGYKIVAPEKLSLSQQINLISSAKEIVTTLGTLSHLAVFAGEGVKLTILLRESETIILQQFIINELKKLDYYFVESTRNILPTTHSYGFFLYYPTNYWYEYLKYNSEKYMPQEKLSETIPPELVYRYLICWGKHYSDPKMFKRISKKEISDVVKAINYYLMDEEVNLPRCALPDAQKRISMLEGEIKKLKASKSWKLTKPLRTVSQKLRNFTKWIKS